MQLSLLLADSSKKSETITVSDQVFNSKQNETLVHQVVTAYLTNARQGTKAQKNRSAVRGGGKKPWKQKGTGQARAGTTRSPIWRKGGVTFAAMPRDYTLKVNKKMYRSAMRAILSELIRQNRLMVIDTFSVSLPKTKDLVNKLQNLNLKETLIVTDSVDENLYFATRNLPHVDVCDVTAANPVNLISFEKILVTAPALKQFEEMLG